jgi:hypothetical protein
MPTGHQALTAASSASRQLPVTPSRLDRVARRYARMAATALRAPRGFVVHDAPERSLLGGHPAALRSGPPPQEVPPGPPPPLQEVLRSPRRSLGAELRSGRASIPVTLWVVDDQDRWWSRRDWRLLRDLAATMGEEVRLLGGESGRAQAAEPGGEPAATAGLEIDPGAAGPIEQSLGAAILASVHAGSMHPGSRLPSVREIADAYAVTPYAAFRAYRALEAEGVVEKRE